MVLTVELIKPLASIKARGFSFVGDLLLTTTARLLFSTVFQDDDFCGV